MERVITSAMFENLMDALQAERGLLTEDAARRIEGADAVVDTRATTVLLPQRMVTALGLQPLSAPRPWGPDRRELLPAFGPIRLTIQGRDGTFDVAMISDDFPAVIGQTALLMLDWVIDPETKRLTGNPEHGGEQVIEIY